jgi:hypothetical protein
MFMVRPSSVLSAQTLLLQTRASAGAANPARHPIIVTAASIPRTTIVFLHGSVGASQRAAIALR